MVGRAFDHVVITGAAAGVGRACALRFAREGVSLGLISRDRPSLEALSAELHDAGSPKVSIASIDVSDFDAVDSASDQFEKDLGPIDLWINDAMLTVFSPVHLLSPGEFRRVTEVTYLGVVHGCMAALKHMRPRDQGHIINIGSALAYRGIPLQSAYCGAKHAIRGFTASLMAELRHDNSSIAASIIELPAMNTPQFDWARVHMARQPKPMGTIFQPEVAAEAVLRAARCRPREYWVGVSTFLTIFGNMVAPAFMDWYLGKTAVEGQQTDQLVEPGREDNLYHALSDLHRTRGSFGTGAKSQALTLSGTWTRPAVVCLGALMFLAMGRSLVQRKGNRAQKRDAWIA